MAESIDGTRPIHVIMDEIADMRRPAHLSVDMTTGYGFITSTWGSFILGADDTCEVSKRIGTAIHESLEAACIEPLDGDVLRPSRDDSAAAARRAIDEFAVEMRARDPERARDLSGTTTPTITGTITGKFTADRDDSFYTLFGIDGEIRVGIDPAKPADPDEFVDTIAPLENWRTDNDRA